MLGAVGLGRLDIHTYTVHAYSVAHSGTAVKGASVLFSFLVEVVFIFFVVPHRHTVPFHAPPSGAAGVGACVGFPSLLPLCALPPKKKAGAAKPRPPSGAGGRGSDVG